MIRQFVRYLSITTFTGLAAIGVSTAHGDESCGPDAPSPSALLGGPVAVPVGFADESFSTDWDFAVGIEYLPDGRMIVFERPGLVWLVEADGNRAHDPMIDLREEIESSLDRGLMDVAIDPDFENNGFMYFYYQVDWYYHQNFGQPGYNPLLSLNNRATFSRITRYTALAAQNFAVIDPASRTVLVGTDPRDGFPAVAPFHGIGSIFFGEDGSLIATCGDAASFNANDMGGPVIGSYAADAVADNIIRPAEDVGSWRAQLVDSLAGKVLRFDPATGNGLASNPFFDPAEPRAARSRVWAMGFRMPFRAAIRPGTGSTDITAGNPGTIVLGDVGNNDFEELNILATGGLNGGWPAFEGLDERGIYATANTPNQDEPNPDFNGNTCNVPFFRFRELIAQVSLDSSNDFPMPCNAGQQIPVSVPHFVHHRPALEIGHFGLPARVGIWTAGEPDAVILGEPGSPVSGTSFSGSAVIGGAWCPDISFPAEYHDAFFFADYSYNYMRVAEFDSRNNLISIEPFAANLHTFVYLSFNPTDGSIYYIRYPDEVRRIRYVGGNQPPIVAVSADTMYGPGPLDVQFDTTGTSDPEDGRLVYEWDFGDGTPIVNEENPLHTFVTPDANPISYTVTLTVTDPGGEAVERTMLVSVNNTPPQVAITTINDGDLYSMIDGQITLPLEANIVDAEHGPGELTCAWQTILHHDTHNHPGVVDSACSTLTTIDPVGCEEDATYWYVIRLTVTDNAGLVTTVDTALYPDCSFIPNCPGDIRPVFKDRSYGNGEVNIDDLLAVINTLGESCDGCLEDVTPIGIGNGEVNIDDLLQVLNEFGPCPVEE